MLSSKNSCIYMYIYTCLSLISAKYSHAPPINTVQRSRRYMIIVFFQEMKLHFQTSKRHSFITTTVNDINYFSQNSGKALRPNSVGLSICEPYTLPYHHRYLQKCSKFFDRRGSSYRKFRTDHVSL